LIKSWKNISYNFFKMFLPFKKKQKIQNQKYLGLFLKEQSGILMIIEEVDGKMILKEKRNFLYSNGWENLTEDVNENLSFFKTEEKELNRLVIFIYSHLVDQVKKEIRKPILSAIKKMVSQLSFHPLGYIEVNEAISEFLKEKENLPLTAILIEIDKTELAVFIYKGSRVILNRVISRSDRFIDDLLMVFAEKKQEFLPARIILYNSEDLDKKAESIISFRWPENYFLQIPKVTIIKEEDLIKALLKIFEKQSLERKKEEDFSEKKKMNKERLGFVIGEDIALLERNNKSESSSDDNKPLIKLNFSFPKFSFPKINNWPIFSLKIKNIKLLTFFLGIFVILTLILINELFFHRLRLFIYPKTSMIKKELSVLGIVDNNKEITDKIKISSQSSEIKISLSKKTTGERKIGDKAKGEIIIYNNNLDAGESIAKGTAIVAENGLRFLTDEEVKVSSASGDASNPKPATVKVKVVAIDIGDEYNLNPGYKFKIEGKSANLMAKNEVAFGGGVKKTIKTVAKSDIEELRKQALEKVKSKTFDLEKDKKIINDLTEVILTEEKFSKESGEQADEIELEAKGKKIFYFYDANQLKNRLYFILKKEQPKELIIEKNQIKENLIKVEKIKNGQINLQFNIEALLAKKIDLDSLKKRLVFIDKKQIADVLKDQFQINRYDFKLDLGLFFLEKTPIFVKNIEVEVKY